MDAVDLWFTLANGSLPVEQGMVQQEIKDTLKYFFIHTEEQLATFLSYLYAPKKEISNAFSIQARDYEQDPSDTNLLLLMQLFGALLTHQHSSFKDKVICIEKMKEILSKNEAGKHIFDGANDQDSLFARLINDETGGDFLRAVLWTCFLLEYFETNNPSPSFDLYVKALRTKKLIKRNQLSILALCKIFSINDKNVKMLLENLSVGIETVVSEYQISFQKFDKSLPTLDADALYELLLYLAIIVTHPKVTMGEKLMYLKDVLQTISLIPTDVNQDEIKCLKDLILYFLKEKNEQAAIEAFGVCAIMFYQKTPNPFGLIVANIVVVLDVFLFLLQQLDKTDETFREIGQFQVECPNLVEENYEHRALKEPEIMILYCISGFHTGTYIRRQILKEGTGLRLEVLLVRFREIAERLLANLECLIDWMDLCDCMVYIMNLNINQQILQYLDILLDLLRSNIVKSFGHKKEAKQIQDTFDKILKNIDSCSMAFPLRLISYCSLGVRNLFAKVQDCLKHKDEYWYALLMQLNMLMMVIGICRKHRFMDVNKLEPTFEFEKDQACSLLGIFNCFTPTAEFIAEHLCIDSRGYEKVYFPQVNMKKLVEDIKNDLKSQQSIDKTCEFVLKVGDLLATDRSLRHKENMMEDVFGTMKEMLKTISSSGSEEATYVLAALISILDDIQLIKDSPDFILLYVSKIESYYTIYNLKNPEICPESTILMQLLSLLLQFIAIHKTMTIEVLPQSFLDLLAELKKMIPGTFEH
ncbi:hypothetical protein Ciccas_012866 [Cichlidogyrus casuarinus]|uniref:Uncharacterized protein n=1 Tax=Cichlidogyrus casuarinus TaxID=1844966 RepID=A0ABD2PMN3_9PLAT